jgi:hypothetical protein
MKREENEKERERERKKIGKCVSYKVHWNRISVYVLFNVREMVKPKKKDFQFPPANKKN